MDESGRSAMRDATVVWIMAARWEYLATGASPLRHWDQLQDRMRAAARMADDVASWVTCVARGLSLGAPSPERSTATGALSEAVGRDALAWLDMIEEEHGYLMACARLQAEARSAKRAAAREARAAQQPERTPEPVTNDDAQASIFD